MAACDLDHLVIAATSLEDGAAFIRDRLGVAIPRGGRHELMGTHNCLMRLGSNSYLEVVSIDQEAVRPERPRWYALDDSQMHSKLTEGFRLITWVLRTKDISPSHQESAVALGEVIRGSRSNLSWRLTVPTDGHLPGGGVIPSIIEWDSHARPWESMADFGCELVSLDLKHPDPEWVKAVLAEFCSKEFSFVSVSKSTSPSLSARISTPFGDVDI